MSTTRVNHVSDREAGRKILWTSGADASPFLLPTSNNISKAKLKVKFWKAGHTMDVFIPQNHLSGYLRGFRIQKRHLAR